MKNKINKKRILEICIQHQQQTIDSYTQRETEIYSDAFSMDSIPSQTEDRKAAKVELLQALGTELTFAQQELDYLHTLDVEKECSLVESGAVVVTEQLTFYIGVSSGKIEVDGELFFGISIKAPIYESMKGLKKGSAFQFGETKYLIGELY